MRIAVVGLGNVGCALLYPLAYNSGVNEVLVMSRSGDVAMAAILDVVSASPLGGAKMSVAPYKRISDADIVVLTSGVQMAKGETASDVLQPNMEIADSILASGTLKPSAIVICMATPVDYVTVYVQKKTGLPRNQVFGFGGDLDRNRLEYVLRRAGKIATDVSIVGEHGANAIPIYPGESDYTDVAKGVRKFLSTITSYAGETRNLASGDLLGKLVGAVVDDTKTVHHVCGYHPAYGVYLTWPFKIGRTGIGEAVQIELQDNARRDLESLVSTRTTRSAKL